MNEIFLNKTFNKANELLKYTRYADNPTIREGLSRQFHSCFLDYEYQLGEIGRDVFKRSSVNLETEQYVHKLSDKMNSLAAKFYIAISKKDTDKNILDIKEKLNKKYEVKYLYCDNNINFADNCLNVAKLLKKHGIKMPKTIIGSENYHKNSGVQFNTRKFGTTIVLNTKYDSIISITKSPFELMVHEIIHSIQKNLFILNQKKLPDKYRNLREIHPEIQADINCRCNHEAHADLFTKSILDSLSDDENKLLKYLNSLFL